MIRAQVVTPWVGVGSEANPYRPKLADGFTLVSWRDVTGQPGANLMPSPNAFTIEITCSADTLAAIEAGGYTVLWSESV